MTIEVKTSLGTKIRTWRQLRGLSQQELLAERFSESYLSKVEREQMHASTEFLSYVDFRLGLTVEELLNDTPEAAPVRKMSREAQELILLEARIVLQNSQHQEAKNFLDQLVASQLPTSMLAQYHYILGLIELETKDYNTAVLDMEQALKLYEGDLRATPLEIEQVRCSIGAAHYQRGNYLLAVNYYKRCLQSVKAGPINDPVFLAKLYYNLANAYQLVDEREQALHYYQEAAKFAEAGESLTHQADFAWDLGLAYQAKNDLTTARIYLNKSATLYDSIEQLKTASAYKGFLGRVLVERAAYDEAEPMLQAALEVALRVQDQAGLWAGYLNLAYLYFEQGKLELAESNARQSIERAQAEKSDLWLGQSLAQMAEIRMAQENISEALALFAQAEEILMRCEAVEFLHKVCYRYATALEKQNRTQEAMQMYRKAFEYQNQARNETSWLT